jgi:hypothetical protein
MLKTFTSNRKFPTRLSPLAVAALSLFFDGTLLADPPASSGPLLPPIPDVAATGQQLAAGAHGSYVPFRGTTSNSLPDGPVAGNGDIGLVMGGKPEQIDFYIGKADFWGVQHGCIRRVGWLELSSPQLQNATSEVDQNIGPATITGKFTNGGAAMSFKSWVSATKNMVVTQLTNTGSEPLDFSSKLFDGLTSNGNEATYGSSAGSTWLKVSPDLALLSVGNQYLMNPRGGFQGSIASLKIFDQALNPAKLGKLDATEAPKLGNKLDTAGAPKAIYHWPLSGTAGEHGPTADMAGGDGAGTVTGALLLPQRQFTVTAWVNATGAGNLNYIASTMFSQYGSDKYPFQRGFALNLDKGRLSSTLNYTSTAAQDAFPLNQWVQVAAVYDGNALTLYQNGEQVARTTDFATASQVMSWDKKTIHTGDKDLPFEGCAPEGVMLQRIIGPTTREDTQALKFTLGPGQEATLVLPVVTDRNTPDFMAAAQELAQKADPELLAKLYQDHVKWWADFWSKSFIEIPDKKIQDNWYASLYLLACCSKPGCPPPGLWGNFGNGDNMNWSGDYTLDYNYEAPFWGGLSTNHLELVENYDQVLLDHIPRGLSTAQHYNYQGLYFYCHFIPSPSWSDDYGTFWGQKSLALFSVVNCAQRWRYTHDLAYAKKIYPLLKGVADFWDNYLVLKDSRYVDLDDSACEQSGSDTNPATTLSFLRLVYPCLMEISRLLNVDADRRDRWNDIVTNLSPLPIVTADKIGAGLEQIDPSVLHGNLFIRNTEAGSNFPTVMYSLYHDHQVRTSSPGMNSTLVVFPGWTIGLESSDHDLQAAYNTVLTAAEWFDFNNDCTFYPSAAAVGIDPQLILSNMRALVDSETPNFIIHAGGGTENFPIVPATLSLMFVQSYQENIHIFPNWPMNQDASFGNLNACGGFLVGSEVKQGRILYVKIQSNAAQPCRLVNPWPKAKVWVTSNQRPGGAFSGSILKFATKLNEVLVLTPQH